VEVGFGKVGKWGVGSGKSTPTTNYQSPTTEICFWVRDNGPGIKPEEQERLFTLFTRLDKARAKGHGLGLSIARRIVERLGGQVGVESELGVGSVFWFSLPVADEAPVPGAERKGRRRTNDEPVP
jgi:signal transduction histidine kinase